MKTEMRYFLDNLFEDKLNLDNKIDEISDCELYNIFLPNREQRTYMYGMSYDDTKENLIAKLNSHPFSNELRQDYDCKIWIIAAKINDIPFGAVFAFLNNSEELMIQGISKFIIPSLLSLIEPKLAQKLPKLNNLLLPSVETLARMYNLKLIVVNPVGKQGAILQKYYGFYPIKYRKKICSIILKTPSFDTWLAKDIEDIPD